MSCFLCLSQLPKYTCPRCSIKYCSLSCYKHPSHSHCSELFYKQCIQSTTTTHSPNSNSIRNTLAILKRDLADSSDYNSDVDSLADNLSNINLDTTPASTLFNLLSPLQQQSFSHLIKNNLIDSILPHWEPWWSSESLITKNVYPLNHNINVVPLSNLSATTPHPNIPFAVLDLIIAYIFTLRTLNGDPSDPSQTIPLLKKTSHSLSILKQSPTFVYSSHSDVVATMSAHLASVCACSLIQVAAVLDDARTIVADYHSTVRALSHFCHLLDPLSVNPCNTIHSRHESHLSNSQDSSLFSNSQDSTSNSQPQDSTPSSHPLPTQILNIPPRPKKQSPYHKKSFYILCLICDPLYRIKTNNLLSGFVRALDSESESIHHRINSLKSVKSSINNIRRGLDNDTNNPPSIVLL